MTVVDLARPIAASAVATTRANVTGTSAVEEPKEVKAFARAGERPSNSLRLGAWHTRRLYIAALRFVYDHLWGRFAYFKLGAHFLDLRGLVFHHCREALNRAFQFRDPLLLIEGFVEHGLRRSHLVSSGVDEDRPQLSGVINEHEGGGGHRNAPTEDTGNKGVIWRSKSRVVADADEFQFISSAGIHLCADIDVTFASY